MKIKAILFDMDGVLIDAKEWHYESLNRALDLFGMPISRYDHLTTFDGLPTKKKLEMLSAEGYLPKQIHSFLNEMKQQYTMDLVHTQCKPTFIHQYALSKLKDQGFRIAVCSNSIRNTIEQMMDRAMLTPYIDLIVSNQDVSKGKPDPEMYLKAMSFFGLHHSECLIVEDNENGIKAAKAAQGHLLVVEDVHDVTYDNIMQKICDVEENS